MTARAQQEPPAAPSTGETGTASVGYAPAPTPEQRDAARKQAEASPEAVTRPTPSPLAAYIPDEGFRISTANGNWKLRIGLNAGIKYEATFEPSPVGNDWANFPLAFVRPRIDGNLFRPWIHYWFQLELGQFPPNLIDGFIEVTRWDFFNVRLGLSYSPFSRHESFGPGGLLFPEWSIVANYFWPGYERGITLFGHDIIDRITYYAGLYDGTSQRRLTSIPGNFVLLGRLTINPLGKVLSSSEIPFVTAEGPHPFRFGFTLQGAWGRTALVQSNLNPSSGLVVASPTGAENESATAAADFVFEVDRLAFLSEFYYRHTIPTGAVTPSFNQLGAWAQIGYVFYRRILVAALRFNWVQPDTSLANDQMFTGEAMLGWWIAGPRLSLKLRYQIGYQQDPGPAPAGDPTLFDFVEIPLAPGTSQLLTLQATISF